MAVLGSFHVALKQLPTQLIATFKLPVIFTVFLNGVVCEVNKGIVDIFGVILLARRSDVSFFEDVKVHVLSEQDPYPYVEFAFLNQTRFFDVLLQNESRRLDDVIAGRYIFNRLVGVRNSVDFA